MEHYNNQTVIKNVWIPGFRNDFIKMATSLLYQGQDFPKYPFTEKATAYIFVEFDIVFIDPSFWKIMKIFLETRKISSIVVNNLAPEYDFNRNLLTNGLPEAFLELVRNENLEGYFECKANLHMITNKAIIFSEERDEFCILLDRDYSIGIIGFANEDNVALFEEYAIADVPDYLTINFAGKELPNSLVKALHSNWNL